MAISSKQSRAGAVLGLLISGVAGARSLAAPAPSTYQLFQPLPQVETNGNRPEDVKAIQIANDQWNRNVAERNLDGLVASYAEDGRSIPQGRLPVVGLTALRAYWGELMSLPDFKFYTTDKTIHVSQAGDHAWIYGDYTLSFSTTKGPSNASGRYVLLYEKRNGEWKLVLDIDNS